MSLKSFAGVEPGKVAADSGPRYVGVLSGTCL